MFNRAACLLALMLAPMWCSALCAQQIAANPSVASAVSGPQSPQWHSLSVEEKLKYDAHHLFEIDNLVYAGIGAAMDQARDRPPEWGQGWRAYSERYASHVGQYLIQRSIMFPV